MKQTKKDLVLGILVFVLFFSCFTSLVLVAINKCDFENYTYTGYVDEIEFLDSGCCGGDTVVYFNDGNILVFIGYKPLIPKNKNITFYYHSLCDKDKFKLYDFEVIDQDDKQRKG